MSHQSLWNAEAAVGLFRIMFTDSNVASKLKLGKDKTSYFIVYSLAPYFKNKLMKIIKNLDS